MEKVTDVWFETELELELLARKLELESINYDFENCFEWVIGSLDEQELNISRAHEGFTRSKKVTTISLRRIEQSKIGYSVRMLQLVVSQLKNIGIAPIYLGQIAIGKDDELIILNLVATI